VACRAGVVLFQQGFRKRAAARTEARRIRLSALQTLQRWARGAPVRRKFQQVRRRCTIVQCLHRRRVARRDFKVRRREFREVKNLVGEQQRLRELVQQMQEDISRKAHISEEAFNTIGLRVAQLEEEKDTLVQICEHATNEADRLRACVSELTKGGEQLRAEKAQLAAEKRNLKDRVERVERENKHAVFENDRLKATGLELQRDRASLAKDLAAIKLQKHELWASYAQLQKQNTDSTAEHVSAANRLKSLETQVFLKSRAFDELSIRYNQKSQQVDSLQETCARMENVHAELRREHEEADMRASSSGDQAERGAAAARDLEAALASRDLEIQRLRQNLMAANTDYSSVSRENEGLRPELEEARRRIQQLGRNAVAEEAARKQLEKKASAAVASIAQLRAHCESYDDQAAADHGMIQVMEQNLKKARAEASEASERADSEVLLAAEHKARSDLLATELAEQRTQLSDANAFISELRAQVEALRGQQNSAYERVRSMRAERG